MRCPWCFSTKQAKATENQCKLTQEYSCCRYDYRSTIDTLKLALGLLHLRADLTCTFKETPAEAECWQNCQFCGGDVECKFQVGIRESEGEVGKRPGICGNWSVGRQIVRQSVRFFRRRGK
jgi:hypothetical protein